MMLIDVFVVIFGFILAGIIFHIGCTFIYWIEVYQNRKLIEYRNKLRAKSSKEFWEDINQKESV